MGKYHKAMKLLAQEDPLEDQWSRPALKWKDDSVQFPRLIAEISATQEHFDMETLAESMDLEVEDVNEIFDRADRAWELIKQRLFDDFDDRYDDGDGDDDDPDDLDDDDFDDVDNVDEETLAPMRV